MPLLTFAIAHRFHTAVSHGTLGGAFVHVSQPGVKHRDFPLTLHHVWCPDGYITIYLQFGRLATKIGRKRVHRISILHDCVTVGGMCGLTLPQKSDAGF